jgi:heat shock protein HslJ
MRALVVALALATACARGIPGGRADDDLVGTAWRLRSIGGTPVLNDVEATLEFPEAGRVAGRGSCNRFFGTVVLDGESLRIGGIGATRMACAEPVMKQEDAYLRALEAATRVRRDGKALVVEGKGAVLGFEKR